MKFLNPLEDGLKVMNAPLALPIPILHDAVLLSRRLLLTTIPLIP